MPAPEMDGVRARTEGRDAALDLQLADLPLDLDGHDVGARGAEVVAVEFRAE